MGLQGYNPNELVEILTPYFCRRDDGCLTFTPGSFTSIKWDGDAKVAADGIIDLSVDFGLPAGVAAISVLLIIEDETAHVAASLSSTSGAGDGIDQWTQVANQYIEVAGIVVCDSNGDIYFTQSGELDEVYIRITGYWS